MNIGPGESFRHEGLDDEVWALELEFILDSLVNGYIKAVRQYALEGNEQAAAQLQAVFTKKIEDKDVGMDEWYDSTIRSEGLKRGDYTAVMTEASCRIITALQAEMPEL